MSHLVLSWALALIVAGTALVARADNNHRVILLRPLVADDIAAEAQARVRGELIAAGFEVIVIAQEQGVQLRDGVETAGRYMSALAAYAIRTESSTGGSTAEIYVSDRLRNKLLTEKSVLDRKDPGRGAAVLAVQAVELLKASLADYWLASNAPPPPPPPPPPPQEAPPPPITLPEPAPAHSLFGLEMGVAFLEHFGKNGGALLPSVKVSVAPRKWIAARLSLAGLGPGSSVEAPAGSATVQQEIGTLEVLVVPVQRRWGSAFLTLGGGVYHLHLVGSGIDPYVGKSGSAWSGTAIAGGGARIDLARHVAAVAEAQAVLLLPPPEIRFDDTLLGPAGRPSLLASAGLVASF